MIGSFLYWFINGSLKMLFPGFTLVWIKAGTCGVISKNNFYLIISLLSDFSYVIRVLDPRRA